MVGKGGYFTVRTKLAISKSFILRGGEGDRATSPPCKSANVAIDASSASLEGLITTYHIQREECRGDDMLVGLLGRCVGTSDHALFVRFVVAF